MAKFLKIPSWFSMGLLISLFAAAALHAFPPALPHGIYGMARDEYGNPLTSAATVVFTTPSGVSITAKVTPGLAPGVNYRLSVPMDSGVKADTYKPNALHQTASFRIRVNLNNKSWLPIEMAGDYSSLGLPGRETRIDLTLGEDLNGNGLPDAWERAMIAARGWNISMDNLNANSSPGSNGVTLLQEYIAGSYGLQDENGLSLDIVRVEKGNPIIEFMAVRGRTYSIWGSPDLKTWSKISFRLTKAGTDQSLAQNYLSSSVELVQVAAAQGEVPNRFFKLRIE